MKKILSCMISIMLILQMGIVPIANAAEYTAADVDVSFIASGGIDTAIEGEFAYVLYDSQTVKKVNAATGAVISTYTVEAGTTLATTFDERVSNKLITVSNSIVCVKTVSAGGRGGILGYLIDFSGATPTGHSVFFSGWGAVYTVQIASGYVFLTAADELRVYRASDLLAQSADREQFTAYTHTDYFKISNEVAGCLQDNSVVYDWTIQWDGVNEGVFVTLPQCWSGNIQPTSSIIIGKLVMDNGALKIGEYITENVYNLVKYGCYTKYVGSDALVLNDKLYVTNRHLTGAGTSWYLSENDEGLFSYDLSTGTPVYDNLQLYFTGDERVVGTVPFADKAAAITTAGRLYVLDPDNGYAILDTFNLNVTGNVTNIGYTGDTIWAHAGNGGYALVKTNSAYNYDLSYGSLFGEAEEEPRELDSRVTYKAIPSYDSVVEGKYAYVIENSQTVSQIDIETGAVLKSYTLTDLNKRFGTTVTTGKTNRYISVSNGKVLAHIVSYTGGANNNACGGALIDFNTATPTGKIFRFKDDYDEPYTMAIIGDYVYVSIAQRFTIWSVEQIMQAADNDEQHDWQHIGWVEMSSALNIPGANSWDGAFRLLGTRVYADENGNGKFITLPQCWGNNIQDISYVAVGDLVGNNGVPTISTDNLVKISLRNDFPGGLFFSDNAIIDDGKLFITNCSNTTDWSLWEHSGVYVYDLGTGTATYDKKITVPDATIKAVEKSGDKLVAVADNGYAYVYDPQTEAFTGEQIEIGVLSGKPVTVRSDGKTVCVQMGTSGFVTIDLSKKSSISIGKTQGEIEAGQVSIVTNIANSDTAPVEDCQIIAALYNSEKMCDVQIKSRTIAASGSQSETFRFNVPEDADGMYAKVFAVKGTESMEPYCASAKLEEFNTIIEQTYGVDVYNTPNAPLKVAFLGGSITEGHMYSRPVVDNFFAAGGRQVEYINQGIGGTGSALGAFRLQNDILSYNPDVVFIEYSVNDAGVMDAGITYEAILRQLIEAPHQPIIIPVNVTTTWMQSATDRFDPVCAYYGVNDINVQEYLQGQVDAGATTWEQLFAGTDGTHPNETLGQIYANYIISCLTNEPNKFFKKITPKEEAYSEGYAFTKPALVPAVDAQYTGFTVESTTNRFVDDYLLSNTAGSQITFNFTGNTIGFYVYSTMNGTTASYVIDGVHKGKIDTYEMGHPNMAMAKSLRYDLDEGEHTIVITVDQPKYADRTQFAIGYFMVDGQ